MPHHFTKNVVSAAKHCNHCNRQTQHYVADGRVGQCMEHGPKPRPPKHSPVALAQEGLFEQQPANSKTVEITARQFAELEQKSLGSRDPESRVRLSLGHFLDLVDGLKWDAPIWALEMAVDLDGAKKY